MSGYAFFVTNKEGSLNLHILVGGEEPELDDLAGEKVIARLPLSDKSLKAMQVISHVESIEFLTGSQDNISSLIWWIVEKTAKAAFALGKEEGRKEQAGLTEAIERLIKEI